jgi:HSP20 family protein
MLGLTRWNPFEELSTLHRELDRLFNRVFGDERAGVGQTWETFSPAMEVYSNDEACIVRLSLPGVDPKKVDVTVTGQTLTVRGERRRPEDVSEDRLYVSEIPYGRFERIFTLPEAVDGEKVKASYINGVLEIRMPLKEAAKPRRVEIAAPEPRALAA